MNIVVLGGGISTERDVSLRSAAAVSGALETAGFTVTQVDPKAGFHILDTIPDNAIIFPILHGQGGEDGVIQAELERRKLPYLGSDSKVSSICFDKWQTRNVLERAGLPVAKGATVTAETYHQNPLVTLPHVLKVLRGGSSIGTYIVHDPSQLDEAKVADVFKLDAQAVIEEFIAGTEITVPILDKKALPVIEIKPPSGADFDYENKYNGATEEHCPPISVSADLQVKAQQLAEQVHQALGARHISRVDIIIKPSGDMVVLELNTIPGMTEQSLYPKSAAVAGNPMPELMKQFVSLVQKDYSMQP